MKRNSVWRKGSAVLLALVCLSLTVAACGPTGGTETDSTASSAASAGESSSTVSPVSQPGKGNFTGVWQRTGIPQSQSATLTVRDETKTSFFFSVNARSGANVGTTEGVAHLVTADEATCTYNTGAGATLTFRVKEGVLTVEVSNHEPLGFGKGVTMDGQYTLGTPEYTAENWDSRMFENLTDPNAYADMLDGDASLFLTDVLTDGSLIDQYEVAYPAGEMYRFTVQAAGLAADILRTDAGAVFIGLVGYEEDAYVLYTDDADYRDQPPQEFEEIAADPISLRYRGK